jgi:beta-galactosidase
MPEIKTFPASKPDWNNIEVIHRNTLKPRTDFYLYASESDALARDVSQSTAQCLSGTWQFHHSWTPLEGPAGFHAKDFDHKGAGFVDIAVPGMWQLQGHGKGPHYTNVIYPWPVDPPTVPYEDNECGRYVKTFTLDEARVGSAGSDAQFRLRFEGVDAAFTVWLNGKEVGYSQGSRNPSEFDVSALIDRTSGAKNVLAVEVFQRCDGSYIEDQDQWWLSGIFRDVYLHAFPKTHPLDLRLNTDLDDKYEDGTLQIDVDVSAWSTVELKLLDASGSVVASDKKDVSDSGRINLPVKNPSKWTAETPYLYSLVANFSSEDKSQCSLAQRVGFRKTELLDGVFCVNGKPVKFRGVNRHEHHPEHGRAVPYDFMQQDLLIMKTHNINGIRMSHQINDPRLYDVADELGLWIMDEADLESERV